MRKVSDLEQARSSIKQALKAEASLKVFERKASGPEAFHCPRLLGNAGAVALVGLACETKKMDAGM